MLERLKDFASAQGFFEIKHLGKLDKSCCCQSVTEVVDYDNTKSKVAALMPINQPKSVDALKIISHADRIDFIELKGVDEFIVRNKSTGNETVKNQVKKFDFKRKIIDSLTILDILVKHKDFRASKDEIQEYEKASKFYIIVVDVDLYEDPAKDRLVTLSFLSQKSDIKDEIINEIEHTLNDLPLSPLHNLQKPELLSCRKIDEYYERLKGEVVFSSA